MSKPQPLSFQTTLLVRDHCLCLHVHRAARSLARRFDDLFRPLGLAHGQFSLMMSLNRPSPPAMRDVCLVLAIDRTTLTANLKPLERRGLVAVETDPSDRRIRRLRLTDEGHALLSRAAPLWIEAHGAIEANLGSESAEAIRRGLVALT